MKNSHHHHITFFMLVVCIVSSNWYGCKTQPTPQPLPPTPNQTIGAKGDCTLEQPTWNSVVEGFDQEKSLKILTDISAAASANPSNIPAEGKLNADFQVAVNQIIKATNQKEFKVSQEVQDLMVTLRRLGCDMQAGLFKDYAAAEKQYLALLEKIKFTEKKISTQK